MKFWRWSDSQLGTEDSLETVKASPGTQSAWIIKGQGAHFQCSHTKMTLLRVEVQMPIYVVSPPLVILVLLYCNIETPIHTTWRWSCNTCKDELEVEGVRVKEVEAREKETRPPSVTKQEVSSPPRSVWLTLTSSFRWINSSFFLSFVAVKLLPALSLPSPHTFYRCKHHQCYSLCPSTLCTGKFCLVTCSSLVEPSFHLI